MLGTSLRSSLRICAVSILLSTIAISAQSPAKTQVNPDHSITFRYTNAGATKVEVSSDMLHGKKLPMVRGEDGVWTARPLPRPPKSTATTSSSTA